ncbi:hypothetical protein ZIOFF_066304 [Zingiber officinale]|uniref:Uncharacterized protein n=1 Tax=Zingiber officinale TaxID=94328 RepID=A0A8J5EYC3_ZINOF|nr:hypothetical protein ZIOFF_066304 [Zingiber officinale]
MLAARKSNEKKGAVEEHNLLLLKLNCTNLPLGISQANLNCITKTLSGTSFVLEIENILMALEQIAQLEMATGKDKDVVDNSSTIGMRKSLGFHVGKLPKGPKIGEQYGAPLTEEDYDDDTTTEDSFPLGPESLDCQTTLFNPITEQAMTSAVIETSSNHDLLEFDGILLDKFLEFLDNSPPRENAHHEVPDSVVPNKTVDETSSIGAEITNGQPTTTVQTEDVGRFAYHPDALEFESLLASFTNPFL